MLKCIVALCICLFVAGCATSEEEQQFYHRINEAYDFEVTHCDSFAMARGKGSGEFGLAEAKQQAIKYGEQLGGTHIVWLQVDEGEETKVIAVIYKCLQ